MNGRILLVEDDDSLREILAFNLEDAGFSVDSAENGRQALEVFDPERHETVITDLRMPEMDLRADSGPLPFRLPEGGLDLMELEKQIILAALAKLGGNQSATARYLNIPRHVLLYRLEKYELDEDGPDNTD